DEHVDRPLPLEELGYEVPPDEARRARHEVAHSRASLSSLDPHARARETCAKRAGRPESGEEIHREAPSRRRRPTLRAVTPAHSGGAGSPCSAVVASGPCTTKA